MDGKKIKGSLLAFLETGTVTLATSPLANIRKITHSRVSEDNLFEHLTSFVKKTKINIDIPDYLANTESLQITKKACRILDDLENLNLVTKSEEVASGLCDKIIPTPCISYSITPSGLETALKLQEHDDAEKRFSKQGNMNFISMFISIVALMGVLSNSYFSYKRLERLEVVAHPKTVVSEDNINNASANNGVNEKKGLKVMVKK
jgi:hypothetical protein